MAKKAKSKGKGKSKEKQPDIPAEWVGKTVEELKELVVELKSQLDDARQKRNRAQVEHGSIQSYYDVTREQIRELDMQIEKKDLEIENTLEDNATELRVYEQKANFIKYCHDNRLKEALDDTAVAIKNSNDNHEKNLQNIEAAKVDMRSALVKSEGTHINDVATLQQDNAINLTELKAKLDDDIKLFEQSCESQHVSLKNELEARRAAELNIIQSRKESHMNDLRESHQSRCSDMQVYFEGVERQQQIDIEDLEAEIRRLKKAAQEHEANSNQLRESNALCGEELKSCSEKVVALEIKTKDKDKNATSLRTTNARLAVARKSIREATIRYKQLQEMYQSVEEERNNLHEGITLATSAACKSDRIKQCMLDDRLREQNEKNAVLEQHLEHIVHSAGLDKERSDILQAYLHDFIQANAKELEKLNILIANATKSYNKASQLCRSELIRCGFSEAEIVNVIGET